MRVSRAALPSLCGLTAGFAGALLATVALRASTTGAAALVWHVVAPWRVAAWLLAAAHGVPVVFRSGAGLTSEDEAGGVGRLGDVLGDPGAAAVDFSFSVVLVPLALLLVTGLVTALGVRRARPSAPEDVRRMVITSAVVHATGLALAAWLGAVEMAFEGTLAPELGLEGARGRVLVAIGPHVLGSLGLGAVWGTAFAAAGALSSPPMRVWLPPGARVLLRGWLRGLGASSAAVAGILALGALAALATGRAPAPALVVLGGLLLGPNAAAAGLVLAHGVSMRVALDEGPFTGWERVDYLNVGVSGGPAPWLWFAGLVVPLVAGLVAGRFVRRRSGAPAWRIGLGFGALWGLTLAVLAMLVRVRVLSSFSVGDLDLGGGSAGADPLVALGAGLLWGTAAAAAGAASVRRAEPSKRGWSCPRCHFPNTAPDRFCVSCGTAAESFRPAESR